MAMCVLPQDIVAHLIEHCPGRTDEALQPRFGISYNMWRQIGQGQAMRRSLAQRLIDRVNAERQAPLDDRNGSINEPFVDCPHRQRSFARPRRC